MNRLKRITSIICLALTAAVSLAATPVPACAAGNISYRFSGGDKDKAGYAEGTITLSGVSDGKYKIYWADDKAALAGFFELAEVEVKGGSGSFSLGEHTAIPADAEKLIAEKDGNTSVADAQAVWDIPDSKRLKYKSSDTNYTFMNYSDIHIDMAKHPFYEHSELHWQKALDTAVSRDADFIITAGDNITNGEGPAKEFDRYQEILSDSDYTNPIYECSGNHELRIGEPSEALSTFINATGLDGSDETIAEGKPYYCVEEPAGGDVFVFMALEYLYSPNEGDEFSDAQLDWLSSILDKYYGKNRNIFLIEHALIKGYGAGDDTEDSYYSVPLVQEHKSTQRFMEILEAHPDLIWISGHTHIALKFGYNYSDNNGSSCHMIHDSSVCCPTILNEGNHGLSYTASNGDEYKDLTEGYWVQVFDDEIVFNGINLYHDKVYPAYSYIMESCRSTYADVPRVPEPKQKTSAAFCIKDNKELAVIAHQALVMPKAFLDCDITQADLDLLKSQSKSLLSSLYSYSSYDRYQALKKLAFSKEKSKDPKTDYTALADAYLEFYRYNFDGSVNIYFANTMNWESPRVKLWSSKTSNGKNGEEPVCIGENSDGIKLYRIRVNPHRYNQIQFTDGGDSEVSDIESISGVDNKLFTINTNDEIAPYYLFVDDYENQEE